MVDIKSSLRHEPDAPLWFVGDVGVKVVDVGRFISDLKVPDSTVALFDWGTT